MDPAQTKPVFLITGWGLVLGALMLDVIAIGTPYWLYNSSIYFVQYTGLWTTCTKSLLLSFASCSELGSTLSWIKSIRALMILAALLFAAGYACFTLKIWFLKNREVLLYAGLLTTIAGAFLTLVAVSRFADAKEIWISDVQSLSFSFVFAILGMILGIVACVLVLVHMKRSEQQAPAQVLGSNPT